MAEYDAQHRSKNTLLDVMPQGGHDPEMAASPVRFTIGHLQTVSKSYMHFMWSLHEVYGKSDERRAKATGVRARELSMNNWLKSCVEDQEAQSYQAEDKDKEEDYGEEAPDQTASPQSEAIIN